MAGKGSTRRPGDEDKYRDNYDRIFTRVGEREEATTTTADYHVHAITGLEPLRKDMLNGDDSRP